MSAYVRCDDCGMTYDNGGDGHVCDVGARGHAVTEYANILFSALPPAATWQFMVIPLAELSPPTVLTWCKVFIAKSHAEAIELWNDDDAREARRFVSKWARKSGLAIAGYYVARWSQSNDYLLRGGGSFDRGGWEKPVVFGADGKVKT